jgi:hypothetical protein
MITTGALFVTYSMSTPGTVLYAPPRRQQRQALA